MCLGLFVWLVLGKVDIVAEAPGRLVSKTFMKVVQPADAGVVTEVLVAEGDTVKAGQVLARLDPVTAVADQEAVQGEQQQLDLQVRRIDAELTGTPFVSKSDDPVAFATQTQAQYEARRAAHQQQLRTESAGRDKLAADLRAAEETRTRFQKTLASYLDIERAYLGLEAQGLQSHAATLEKTRDRTEREQELAAQGFTVQGLHAAVIQSEQRLLQIGTDYTKELRQERADAVLRLEKARHDLAKQDHRAQALELKAPTDGVVKDVAAHTAGTVVSPGTTLLTLVPTHEPLRAEVWVKNEDAGFVYPGQTVQLKVAAFPFQKYGLMHGKVLVLSPDAADGSQGGQGPNNGASGAAPNPSTPAPQFKALAELDQQELVSQGRHFPLRAGMQVVVEAHQGRRTILEYLLSPVKKSVMEAARER